MKGFLTISRKPTRYRPRVRTDTHAVHSRKRSALVRTCRWSLVLLGFCGLEASFDGIFGKSSSARTWIVDRQGPRSDDSGPGTRERPFRSISEAAARARPGDQVIVHAGVYRERVAPARGGTKGQPIIYKAAANGTVVIKGSELWEPNWEQVASHSDVWFGAFYQPWFSRPKESNSAESHTRSVAENPYTRALKAKPDGMTTGQIFLNGKPLTQLSDLEKVADEPGSWTATDAGDGLYIIFLRGSSLLLRSDSSSLSGKTALPRRNETSAIFMSKTSS